MRPKLKKRLLTLSLIFAVFGLWVLLNFDGDLDFGGHYEALRLVDEHEQRLRAILESEQAAADEKFQALVDLAYLTGILAREAVETEAERLST
jgi:hypothetical protein